MKLSVEFWWIIAKKKCHQIYQMCCSTRPMTNRIPFFFFFGQIYFVVFRWYFIFHLKIDGRTNTQTNKRIPFKVESKKRSGVIFASFVVPYMRRNICIPTTLWLTYKHNLWWRIRKYTWYFWLSRNEKGKMRNNVYYKKSFQHFRKHFKKYYYSCQYSTGKLNNTRRLIRLFRIISIPSKFCYFRPPDHVISMD